MSGLVLLIMDGMFSIHRLDPGAEIPAELLNKSFVAVTRTCEELSIVCSQDIDLASEEQVKGWRCFKVEGPLDFSLTGIVADLSRILADAGISLFVISTYDTDYLLVRADAVGAATEAFTRAGYLIR